MDRTFFAYFSIQFVCKMQNVACISLYSQTFSVSNGVKSKVNVIRKKELEDNCKLSKRLMLTKMLKTCTLRMLFHKLKKSQINQLEANHFFSNTIVDILNLKIYCS